MTSPGRPESNMEEERELPGEEGGSIRVTWPPTQDLWQPPGAGKGSGEFPLWVSVGSMALQKPDLGLLASD